MRDELIEAVRAAIANALVWEVEGDVRAGELTHEEQTKAAQAAVAAIEARGMLSQGWRDIESAPRDGTVIDLWANGVRYCDCFWHPDDARVGQNYIVGAGDGELDWYTYQDGGYWLGVNPTHWQPLPAPPVAAAEGDE